jgi:hypothetical protein
MSDRSQSHRRNSVLKQIYSGEAYYKRIKLYLSRMQAAHSDKRVKQRWLTRANMPALVHSFVRQGVFGRQRWSYWKFVAGAATRYRHSFSTAMTLAVIGYHFQVMTHKLSKYKVPELPAAANQAELPSEAGEQA